MHGISLPIWRVLLRSAAAMPAHCCPHNVRGAPGLLQALAALRAQGKRLLFVTNNSSKSRQQYVSKFSALGIEAHPQEVSPLQGPVCH